MKMNETLQSVKLEMDAIMARVQDLLSDVEKASTAASEHHASFNVGPYSEDRSVWDAAQKATTEMVALGVMRECVNDIGVAIRSSRRNVAVHCKAWESCPA